LEEVVTAAVDSALFREQPISPHRKKEEFLGGILAVFSPLWKRTPA